MLRWSLETFNKIPSVIPAAGNHDTRASDTYEEARTLFCDFAAGCDVETDNVYYATSVNGYPFIVLGSEAQHRLDAEISPVQLKWFEEQLQNALKTEKPVFIISHQPLYNSNNVLYCVNIPSAVKTEDGGLGMSLEVYPGKIILRARNYITAEWLDAYTYTFEY